MPKKSAESLSAPHRSAESIAIDATSETAVDAEISTTPSSKVGEYCQTSPYEIEMEVLVMPMVQSLSEIELRIPFASISAEKRKILKRV